MAGSPWVAFSIGAVWCDSIKVSMSCCVVHWGAGTMISDQIPEAAKYNQCGKRGLGELQTGPAYLHVFISLVKV